MRKRLFSLVLISTFFSSLLTGCKGSTVYKDGTYSGASNPDDRGAYGEATIVIAENKISDCEFVTWQADGSLKDAEYGKVGGEISNPDFYEKAQLAVNAMAKYAEQLEETQKLSDVDAITGATISYNQFVEAVESALEQAGE